MENGLTRLPDVLRTQCFVPRVMGILVPSCSHRVAREAALHFAALGIARVWQQSEHETVGEESVAVAEAEAG